MLQHALALAARGFPVFPVWWIENGACACRVNGFCKPGRGKHEHCTAERCKVCAPGKHPMPPRGHVDASSDPNQIAEWWRIAPSANVGVRPPPGVLVLDVDPRHAGHERLGEYEAHHGPLPRTLVARTGGGGLHAYFAVPAELSWPKALPWLVPPVAPDGRVPTSGLDLKSHTGYVLAAPSNHESGGRYEWLTPLDTPIAAAPAWLTALGYLPAERPAVIDEDEGELLSDAELQRTIAQLAPLFEKGKKHAIAFAVGGWLRQRGWNSSDVVRLVEALPSSNPRARVKDAVDGYKALNDHGWNALKAAVGEHAAAELDAVAANPKRAERAAAEAAAADVVAAMAAAAVVLPPPPAPAPPPATAAGPTLVPPPLPPGAGMPPIVGDVRGSQFWIARGADYFTPVSKSMLPARVREAGHRSYDDKGNEKKIKADDIAAAAVIAEKVVRDFAATGIQWVGAERAIVQGYQLPRIAPAFDARVDAWLRALTGPRHDYLAQWFATCSQENINALAACLVLVGGTGIGKTLVATLAARMWGASAPVPLAHAIDKFNSTITKCPIVLDDEAARMKQGDVATSDFREMLSSRERTYEPKGVDKRELRGCQRFVITANSFSDLKFSDVGALDVVEALADRLLVIPCGRSEEVRQALEALRLPGTDDVDIARLDSHVAAIVANTQLATRRFLASPGRNDAAARHAVLDGLVQQYPELFDRALDAIDRGEFTANNEPPPMFVQSGLLWVRGDRAGDTGASGRPLSARDVYRALAPWELMPRRETVRVKSGCVRARAYDIAQLKELGQRLDVMRITQLPGPPPLPTFPVTGAAA
jgi:hypothetical protein